MERYEEWISRAKSSYELAKTAGNVQIYYEDLCYQTQQAVEKGIKLFFHYMDKLIIKGARERTDKSFLIADYNSR